MLIKALWQESFEPFAPEFLQRLGTDRFQPAGLASIRLLKYLQLGIRLP